MGDGEFKFQAGFGNHFSTEAIAGALPLGQNTPQKVPFGLFAEQLSGTSFTSPRSENLRTWTYRIRPSVVHGSYQPMPNQNWQSAPFDKVPPTPNQLRWNPIPLPTAPTDLIEGLHTVVGNGTLGGIRGCGVHIYAANRSMEDRYFFNVDGEMLFVPQMNRLKLVTELGILDVKPGHLAVIPRGVRFQAHFPDGTGRGYVCENYGPAFRLPNLGPIGANGLANARDFLAPVAHFEDQNKKGELVQKFQGGLYRCEIDRSPLDVVAWHGNYYPYQYDLDLFQVYSPVRFDHPDPSIFTVLTSPSEAVGVANVDFVIFSSRWIVTEKTFRPPYFHRNIMSEFTGNVYGQYDARPTGFDPGGAALHNSLAAHGPSAEAFEKASTAALKPEFYDHTLSFMFESSLVFRPTEWAMKSPALQPDYLGTWRGIKPHFNPVKK